MKLHRSPSRFFANFIRVTEHQLGQLKVVRRFFGGVWVKYKWTWTQVSVLREYEDGSLLLSMPSYDGKNAVTFHGTNMLISGLEDYR